MDGLIRRSVSLPTSSFESLLAGILGDPGADKGGEGKSKRAEKYIWNEEKFVVFWHQSEARTAATVWNWSGKTLSPGALLAVLYFSSFHIYFSARLDFPTSPLSAPGSPRMASRLFTLLRWVAVGLFLKKESRVDGLFMYSTSVTGQIHSKFALVIWI